MELYCLSIPNRRAYTNQLLTCATIYTVKVNLFPSGFSSSTSVCST